MMERRDMTDPFDPDAPALAGQPDSEVKHQEPDTTAIMPKRRRVRFSGKEISEMYAKHSTLTITDNGDTLFNEAQFFSALFEALNLQTTRRPSVAAVKQINNIRANILGCGCSIADGIRKTVYAFTNEYRGKQLPDDYTNNSVFTPSAKVVWVPGASSDEVLNAESDLWEHAVVFTNVHPADKRRARIVEELKEFAIEVLALRPVPKTADLAVAMDDESAAYLMEIGQLFIGRSLVTFQKPRPGLLQSIAEHPVKSMNCRNCTSRLHDTPACQLNPRCAYCGKNGHKRDDCSDAFNDLRPVCCICGGYHPVYSHDCCIGTTAMWKAKAEVTAINKKKLAAFTKKNKKRRDKAWTSRAASYSPVPMLTDRRTRPSDVPIETSVVNTYITEEDVTAEERASDLGITVISAAADLRGKTDRDSVMVPRDSPRPLDQPEIRDKGRGKSKTSSASPPPRSPTDTTRVLDDL
jgi:hypothetical protein